MKARSLKKFKNPKEAYLRKRYLWNRQPFKEYRVVINIEEQYSVWPTCKEIPSGWSEVGKIGTKQECLDYIKEVWVDMRPKSLKDAENQRKLLN
jgi:MbtH protein